jgi:Ca-activated chloride channel homolog
MKFVGPEVFLLIVPLAGLVALAAWRGRRSLAGWRRALSALLRLAMAAALLFGLARPIVTQTLPGALRLVLVLDVSRSVAESDRLAALESFAKLAAEAPRGSDAAIVRFAGKAEIYRNPVTAAELADPAWRAAASRAEGAALLAPDRTDLARALDLARGLESPGTATRFVLATDGNTPSAPAAEALASFRAAGAPVFVIPISRPDPSDAVLEEARFPSAVEAGLPFDVEASVRGAADRAVAVRLLVDDREIARRDVPAGATTTRVSFAGLDADPGSHRIAVEVVGDDLPENDRADGSLVVRERPRVLVVGKASESPLPGALGAQDFAVDVADELPKGEALAGLDAYSAVVLLSSPGSPASDDDAARLRRFVSDFGGGLLVFGGPRDSRLEALRTASAPLVGMLPVDILEEEPEKPPEKPPEPPEPPPTPPSNEPPKPAPKEKPQRKRILGSTLALVLAIDKSGSMYGEKMELVKRAAYAAAQALDPDDLIAVLAFDSEPKVILPLGFAGELPRIRAAIDRLEAGGGTRFVPVLALAREALAHTPARIKHVILLTDGATDEMADFKKIAADMAQDRITLSTLGIMGKDFESKTLAELAEYGGGRFDVALSMQQIPQIFLTEVGRVVGEAQVARDTETKKAEEEAKHDADLEQKTPEPPVVKTEPKKPDAKPPEREPPKPPEPKHVRLADPTAMLRGIAAPIPDVARTNPTRTRFSATTALEAIDGARRWPLMASWGFGLGRVVVFTSDAGEAAAPDWPAWADYPKLWGQVVRAIRRVPESVAVPRALTSGEPADEDRHRLANRPLLESIARVTGGAVPPEPAAVLASPGEGRTVDEPYGFGWLLVALLLLPIDVAIRRLGA